MPLHQSAESATDQTRVIRVTIPASYWMVLALIILAVIPGTIIKPWLYHQSTQSLLNYAQNILDYGVFSGRRVVAPKQPQADRDLLPGYPAVFAVAATLDVSVRDDIRCFAARPGHASRLRRSRRWLACRHWLPCCASCSFIASLWT